MDKILRPRVLAGLTIKVPTGCGNMYVILNWKDGRLFEVFATLGKSGGCSQCYSEALTRSITAGLRSRSKEEGAEGQVNVDDYVDQLANIRCPNPHSFPKEESNVSCVDAISKALKEFGKLKMDMLAGIFQGINASGGAPVLERDELKEAMIIHEKQAETFHKING